MPLKRLHPFLRLVLCGLGLLIIQSGITALCIGLYLASLAAKHQPLEVSSDFIQRYSLPFVLLSYPPSLLFIALCRTKLDKVSFVSLGLRPIRVAPDLARGLLGGITAIGFLWSVLWLTGGLQVKGWSPELLQSGLGAIVPLLGFVLAFGAVGLFEEVLFRGYILHNFTGWLGWRWGIALQAILFAVVHLGNVVIGTSQEKLAALGALPAIALIGLFFALSARKTGSLWFAIGFHATWDFALGCIYSLPVSGIKTFRLLDVEISQRTWLSGGSFGAEGSFLLIPILMALIYFMSLVPDHPQTALDLALSSHASPATAPSQVVQPALQESEFEDEPEEQRENRFKARFGSETGFDSDTLRQLRQLQEQRDRDAAEQERAARDRQREAEQARLIAATPTLTASTEMPVRAPSPEPVEVPVVAQPGATTPAVELQKPAATEPVVAVTPPKVSTPSTSPQSPALPRPVAPTPPAPTATPAAPENPTPSPSPTPKPVKKNSPRW